MNCEMCDSPTSNDHQLCNLCFTYAVVAHVRRTLESGEDQQELHKYMETLKAAILAQSERVKQ